MSPIVYRPMLSNFFSYPFPTRQKSVSGRCVHINWRYFISSSSATVSYTHLDVYKRQECTWGGQFADYVTAFFAPLQRIRLRCDTHFVQHTGKFQPQRSSAAFRQQFHPTEAMRTASCHGHSIHWNVASLCSDRPILRNRKTVGICAMRILSLIHI